MYIMRLFEYSWVKTILTVIPMSGTSCSCSSGRSDNEHKVIQLVNYKRVRKYQGEFVNNSEAQLL